MVVEWGAFFGSWPFNYGKGLRQEICFASWLAALLGYYFALHSVSIFQGHSHALYICIKIFKLHYGSPLVHGKLSSLDCSPRTPCFHAFVNALSCFSYSTIPHFFSCFSVSLWMYGSRHLYFCVCCCLLALLL